MSSLFMDGALLPTGQYAEEVAIEFLLQLKNVQNVQDVRAIPDWQAKEIDYRVTLHTGEVRGVEVKSDAHIDRTGNVLFELMRIHHTSPTVCAYPGWGVFSEAYYLLVFSPASRNFRLFGFGLLRAAMQKFTREKRGATRISWITSDATRSTLNLLIPLSIVPHWLFTPTEKGWRMEAHQ